MLEAGARVLYFRWTFRCSLTSEVCEVLHPFRGPTVWVRVLVKFEIWQGVTECEKLFSPFLLMGCLHAILGIQRVLQMSREVFSSRAG